jgi:hypothetical protein
VYGGKKPFSEAESRVVKLIAETVRPRAYVNLHSGEWAMYVPWDSKQELAPDLPVCRSFIFSPLLLSSLHYLLPCAIFIFFPVLSSSSLNCLLPCTIFFLCYLRSSSLNCLLPCAIFFNDIALLMQ